MITLKTLNIYRRCLLSNAINASVYGSIFKSSVEKYHPIPIPP
jgi:hypothetical protein